MNKVFQYVVVLHPTEKEKKDGAVSKIIVPITTIIATDERTATLIAGKAIPQEYLDTLNRCEVIVRPF